VVNLNYQLKELKDLDTTILFNIKVIKIFLKIITFLKINYLSNKNSKLIISHNNKIFIQDTNNKKTDKKALFEFSNYKSLIIAYSYFSKVLMEKNYQLIAYNLKNNFFKNFIFRLFKPLIYEEYNSIGISKFLFPRVNKNQRIKAKQIFFSKINKIKDKKKIEKICLEGILIGDLLYDAYLRDYKKGTIDLNDDSFKEYAIRFIEKFLFYKEYIEKNKVKVIVCNHTVYDSALTIRIGFTKNCKCFQVTPNSVFQLSKKHSFAYRQFEVYDYKKIYKKLHLKNKKNIQKLAKERIDLRFSGVVGVDMGYSTKSGYGSNFFKKRVIKKSSKIKILIAPHDFLDNPHGYSKNIFADFYEWFKFLGEYSKNNKYDWYVKCHPDYRKESLQILREILIKYPNIKFLPPSTSHHQIIQENIDYVYTMYGTIGWEYPYLGVQCVNATYNNPRYKYNFNLNPKNLKEFQNILDNLRKYKKKFTKKQKQEILEFYYFQYLYFKNKTDWLVKRDEDMIEKIGGYRYRNKSILSDKFYKYWLENFDIHNHENRLIKIKKFINSKNYFLRSDIK